jgi:ubiquinone/menaquinone biosynthesis C-methylase UbiE
MADKTGDRHEHAGRSSRAYLSAETVVAGTGLKAGDIFLDVGSADGYYSLEASRVVGGRGRVYAIDNYEASISVLKEQIEREGLGNIEAVTADATKRIPLDAGTVDVCLLANVLHGFVANGEVERVLREAARVVRAGGTLAVVEFKKVSGPPGPPLSIRMSPEEVESMVAPYGFEKVRSFEVGPHHYEMVLRRA